ncbi:MAG: hypothetical protein ACYDH8_10105 [Syntrophales bacterium]
MVFIQPRGRAADYGVGVHNSEDLKGIDKMYPIGYYTSWSKYAKPRLSLSGLTDCGTSVQEREFRSELSAWLPEMQEM